MKLNQPAALVSWTATAALLAQAASAQTLVRAINGPAVNAQYGAACIEVTDQNADGYKDLLVGAPGFNQERGAVYCLSGAFLAFGTGTQTLWTLAPTANPGDRFGAAIAQVGDSTGGDGVADFVVGQPGYDISGQNDVGAIRLVNGVSHIAISLLHGPSTGGALGSSLALCGDVLANGGIDLLVGAPGPLVDPSDMYIVEGQHLQGNGNVVPFLVSRITAGGNVEYGASVASVDLDGDGFREFIIGSPGSANDAGAVTIFSRTPQTSLTVFGIYSSTIPGERLGTSVDAAHDYDGDGAIDIVAGAPDWVDVNGREAGRVVVISSAKLDALTPPYEIYTLVPNSSPFVFFDYHFGTAVSASRDLNNDGVGEILVGAPGYISAAPLSNRGAVAIYSGASGGNWSWITGGNNDRLGDSVTGAVRDFDGDGFREFVVAGSLADAGGTDSGVVKCYRLFPVAPGTYCTYKINSLGCLPAIGYSGSPKVSTPATPFLITAANVISQKSGLLFYSHAPITIAFQGGFKCVANPALRTLAQSSGGSASGADCTGTYSVDFNARIASGIDPTLVIGAEVFAQYWARDPASASTTSLSNALRFVINP